MPAAGCGCVLPAPPINRSARASQCSPRSAAGNSACRPGLRMWRIAFACEIAAKHAQQSDRLCLMAEAPSQRRAGIALVVAAAVAWSTAAFFTRLLAFDSWTILFWRGLFGGAAIAAVLTLTQG